MIKASQDMPLPLTVYNYKSQSLRDVSIIPTRNWGGQGMLGVTIRFDTYHNAEEHMVRVLGVAKNSPADLAGLQANSDYLLGTAENVSLQLCFAYFMDVYFSFLYVLNLLKGLLCS
jgi:GRASP55/65 PDZ-like domain